jgi:hypothetical protein
MDRRIRDMKNERIIVEVITDITPTHFMPYKARHDDGLAHAYFDVAMNLKVGFVLQNEKDQDMGGLIELTLPAVQVWDYSEAPSWARIWDDDADFAIFVPDYQKNFDIEHHLRSLAACDFHGPVNVPGGQVWTAHHA